MTVATTPSQLQIFQQHLTEPSEAPSDDSDVKFLLSEFTQLCQVWKHIDSRLESGLRLYLTISTITVSAAALLSSQVDNFKVFLVVAIFVALVLFVSGLLLVRRIRYTHINKAEYVLALNLIRGFFVDRKPEIAPYLYLPFPDSPTNKPKQLEELVEARLERNLLVFVMDLWISLLLGFSAGAFIWLLAPALPLAVTITSGVLVAVAFLSWFIFTTKREIKKILERRSKRHLVSDAQPCLDRCLIIN